MPGRLGLRVDWLFPSLKVRVYAFCLMRVRELARYHVRGDVSLGSLVDKLRKVSVFTIMGDRTDRDHSNLFQFSDRHVCCVYV